MEYVMKYVIEHVTEYVIEYVMEHVMEYVRNICENEVMVFLMELDMQIGNEVPGETWWCYIFCESVFVQKFTLQQFLEANIMICICVLLTIFQKCKQSQQSSLSTICFRNKTVFLMTCPMTH